jgi:hypothetical protein
MLCIPLCFSSPPPYRGASTRFQASPYGASRSHSLDAPHSVGFLWTSDQPVVETSTWQHTTLTRYKHLRSQRDSNPHSQQESGRRPTPRGHGDQHLNLPRESRAETCCCQLNPHRLANKLYLVVFMTVYHHSIYCDLIHNEDATNKNRESKFKTDIISTKQETFLQNKRIECYFNASEAQCQHLVLYHLP